MQAFLKAPEGVAIQYRDGSAAEALPLVWSHFDEAENLHVWEVLNPYPDRPIRALTVEVLPAHTKVRLAGRPRL